MKRLNFLLLTGVSGSGKSHLQTNLIKKFNQKYSKIEQVTTRRKRPDEFDNPQYKYISKMEYGIMDRFGNLFARTVVNDHNYGTIVSSINPKKINTIIIDMNGYMDFMQWTRDNFKRYDIKILEVCLTVDSENIKLLKEIRPDRNLIEESRFITTKRVGHERINIPVNVNQRELNYEEIDKQIREILI